MPEPVKISGNSYNSLASIASWVDSNQWLNCITILRHGILGLHSRIVQIQERRFVRDGRSGLEPSPQCRDAPEVGGTETDSSCYEQFGCVGRTGHSQLPVCNRSLWSSYKPHRLVRVVFD
jgi:hypothetical protein